MKCDAGFDIFDWVITNGTDGKRTQTRIGEIENSSLVEVLNICQPKHEYTNITREGYWRRTENIIRFKIKGAVGNRAYGLTVSTNHLMLVNRPLSGPLPEKICNNSTNVLLIRASDVLDTDQMYARLDGPPNPPEAAKWHNIEKIEPREDSWMVSRVVETGQGKIEVNSVLVTTYCSNAPYLTPKPICF